MRRWSQITPVGVLWVLGVCTGFAQGTVLFSNREHGSHDAPVTFAWDPLRGPGSVGGFTAQLYGGAPGSAVEFLQPLLPATVFRSGTPIVERYIVAVQVSVPTIPPGEPAALLMRVFNGVDWESSTLRGESEVFEVILGGEGSFPANLAPLGYNENITIYFIQEPRATVISVLAVAMFWRRRIRRTTPPGSPATSEEGLTARRHGPSRKQAKQTH